MKVQSASLDVLSQRQTEQNISSRILMKRQELENTEHKTETDAEVASSQKRLRRDHDQQPSSTSTSSLSSQDFESSSFIGRSMLANLGWKEGSALGKTQSQIHGEDHGEGVCEGGAAAHPSRPQSVIEVVQKTNTSGLGSREVGGGDGRDCCTHRKNKNHKSSKEGSGKGGSSRIDNWERAQSRYEKICKEDS